MFNKNFNYLFSKIENLEKELQKIISKYSLLESYHRKLLEDFKQIKRGTNHDNTTRNIE